jgi:ERCC4-type nuclease
MPLIPQYHPNKSEHKRLRLAVQLANCLDGVGFKSAVDYAKHFPNIRSMFSASRDQIESIPGFGKIRAERIWSILNCPRP